VVTIRQLWSGEEPGLTGLVRLNRLLDSSVVEGRGGGESSLEEEEDGENSMRVVTPYTPSACSKVNLWRVSRRVSKSGRSVVHPTPWTLPSSAPVGLARGLLLS
jgi:hypothetical protein